jgi:CubicO group peptidase (beta-lactamase class C family)
MNTAGGIRARHEVAILGRGYTIVQLLIEEVTGESFEAYMQRAVFQPLGMSHFSFQWTPEHGSKLATFCDMDSRPAITIDSPPWQRRHCTHRFRI